MVAKKYWKKSIIEFVKLVRSVKQKKNVILQGFSFQVFPGVFSPVYSSDTEWFAEKIVPLTMNKKFLEIGSGTGIIACLASIRGANQVTATDINPEAIKNISSNAKLHSLNIAVKTGCVFDPLDKGLLFDIIFWNHPFYYASEKSLENDIISSSVCDLEYQCLKKFFQYGKNFLTENGLMLLGTSNIARINLIKKMAKETGYKTSLLEKVQVPIYKGKKIKMDLRIYSFTTS